ncbi:hypothetical protein [Aeromonas salmonicida]
MNQQLSDALIKGERINSNEWHFAGVAEQLSADGYIVKGALLPKSASKS